MRGLLIRVIIGFFVDEVEMFGGILVVILIWIVGRFLLEGFWLFIVFFKNGLFRIFGGLFKRFEFELLGLGKCDREEKV